MLITILNVFAIFIAFFAVLIFAVLFAFFLFIMFACVSIGWREINSTPITDLWQRIKKWWYMSDLLGLSEGAKGLSSGLDSARQAGKTVSKQIENIQKDAVDVAQQQAQERIRARREAEFKKERALIKALDEWKRKKQISDEEADLKIKFVKQYGAKEWDALLKIKLDIENMERKNNEEFQHDLKAVRRVQFYCFMAALIVTLWLKFILGAF